MKTWIVTIKLPKNPEHDPRNKKTGDCPVSLTRHIICTDVTGEHHSVIATGPSAESVTAAFRDNGGFHVTRVEEVN